MLRRTSFARPVWAPAPRSPIRPLVRKVVYASNDAVIVSPKENVVQHAGYMDVVRGLPCIRCGAAPRSQFCHSDEGKGMAIKTDCRLGWPGCAACHYLVGSTGTLGRHERRRLEAEYSALTRAMVIAVGLWPARLVRWVA